MDRDATYEAARADGALVNAIGGKGNEPFWHMAYTDLIRKVREAAQLCGREEPDLQEVAEIAADEGKLASLIEETAKAGNGEPADRMHIRDWYEDDWNGLDPRLRHSITEGLQVAAESAITIERTINGHSERVPIGRRRGPWRDWNAETLPEAAREAVQNVIHEVSGERAAPAERGTIDTVAERIEEARRMAFNARLEIEAEAERRANSPRKPLTTTERRVIETAVSHAGDLARDAVLTATALGVIAGTGNAGKE